MKLSEEEDGDLEIEAHLVLNHCFQHSLFPDYNRPKDGCNTQREMTNQAVVITANRLLLILAIRSLLNSHYSHEASGYFSSCCHLDQSLFGGLVRCPNKYSSIFILPNAPNTPHRHTTKTQKSLQYSSMQVKVLPYAP